MAKSIIAQYSFNSGELSPYMDVRVDQGRYNNGCKVLYNMLPTPHGAVYRRPGMRYLYKAITNTGKRSVRLIPFVFNEEQAYVLEFSDSSIRIWYKSGLILDTNGSILSINTPFTKEHIWSLRVCQTADVMYIVSCYFPPYKLERRGHNNWQLIKVPFGTQVKSPIISSHRVVGGSDRPYEYIITTISEENGEESLPSKPITCKAASTLNYSNYVELSWSSIEGAREYRVFRSSNSSGVFGYIGRAKDNKFTDRGQSADYSQGPPEIRNPFSDKGKYPSQVQFYQQRLCFAGSLQNPQTIWMSKIATPHNFNISYPLQADDACTLTIAADRINSIRWMTPGKKLLVGTVDSEWSISGSNEEAITPTSCRAERQGARGSSDIPPIMIGESVLFVQRGGNVVREYRYNSDNDGFGGSDISILGEHILRNKKIVDWAWQQTPHGVLWCVLDDGTLAGLTLIHEHQIIAWHRHETDGKVEAVTSIPGNNGDEVWLVVLRTIKDSKTGKEIEQRYIEQMDNNFFIDDTKEAFYVDSGMSWEGNPVSTLSNLEHLEGKTVQILADGCVHPPLVVTQGKITLNKPASIIHIGLKYISDVSPMMTEPAEMQGSTIGMKRRIYKVNFRLYKSLGCKVGPNSNKLREVLFRQSNHPLGKPLPLFTGDKTVHIDSEVTSSASVLFRQEEPLPFSLLAVSYELEVGEI